MTKKPLTSQVTVVFSLYGDVKRDLFLTNLYSWVTNANEQLIDVTDIPDVDMIDINIITVDDEKKAVGE